MHKFMNTCNSSNNNSILVIGKYLYPDDLDSARCNVSDFKRFAKKALEIGVQYLGICCGNCAVYFRALAEACGRTQPSSNYSTDSSMSHVFGNKFADHRAEKIRDYMLDNKKY